ncbi:alpha/beta hydrolase [Myxococcota bacterium]|nr:alpha/beta hydrolase [Myxococcota bacterium]
MQILLALLLACADDTTTGDDTATAGDGGGTTADGGGSDGGDGGGDGGTSGDGGTGDGGTGDGGGGDGGGTLPELAPDYREAGPYSVSTSTGSNGVGGGCDMGWTRVRPADVSDPPTVIYAHGFQRSSANHTEVAQHLASWGLQVYLVDLCHSTVLDADHEQNGLDMVALRGELGLDSALYAGHSAGGLAALVAGASDPSALGVLGMDPVDAFDVGGAYAGDVSAPTFGVHGESAACNAHGNGTSIYGAVPGALLLRVTDADHCDFEGPSDWICTTFCTGGNETLSDAEIVEVTRALGTAALLWASGTDVAGQWWTDGQDWYEELQEMEAISVP